ncbi:KH domain-containing protein [Patescibacteria group bacterium]|nr:KH domain-containing protein [Patescibacteria group bacterium]MBU4022752.1 KH domain-containing protein [Patescibacteria group bacterium]MBU4078184.1 KH domain-containing protein [Patescibacteria group bacterium]
MADKNTEKDFLEYVVTALVDHPEDVKIDRTVDEMGVLLTLNLHKEDMGQIIGREGSTVRAIRTLLRIIGLKNHARVNLKIEEPEGGTGGIKRAPSQDKESEGKLEDLKL